MVKLSVSSMDRRLRVRGDLRLRRRALLAESGDSLAILDSMAEERRRAGRGGTGLGYINGRGEEQRRGDLGGRREWWRIKQRQQGPTPQHQQQRRQDWRVLSCSLGVTESQSHRVTEVQRCRGGGLAGLAGQGARRLGGEVARHRNTRPCQSSAGTTGSVGRRMAPRCAALAVGSAASIRPPLAALGVVVEVEVRGQS